MCAAVFQLLMGKIEMGNSDPIAARRRMQKTEFRAAAAVAQCHRFISLKKSFVCLGVF